MALPSIPPLPDPHVVEFDANSMSPVWREFWVKLLMAVSSGAALLTADDASLTALLARPVLLAPSLVGGLPAPAAGNQGWHGFVTDATQTLTAGIGAVVAGSGGNAVPVVSDGSNWRIG
jgi:hypothetical protein